MVNVINIIKYNKISPDRRNIFIWKHFQSFFQIQFRLLQDPISDSQKSVSRPNFSRYRCHIISPSSVKMKRRTRREILIARVLFGNTGFIQHWNPNQALSSPRAAHAEIPRRLKHSHVAYHNTHSQSEPQSRVLLLGFTPPQELRYCRDDQSSAFSRDLNKTRSENWGPVRNACLCLDELTVNHFTDIILYRHKRSSGDMIQRRCCYTTFLRYRQIFLEYKATVYIVIRILYKYRDVIFLPHRSPRASLARNFSVRFTTLSKSTISISEKSSRLFINLCNDSQLTALITLITS